MIDTGLPHRSLVYRKAVSRADSRKAKLSSLICCQSVFGALDHSVHKQRRDAVKTFSSKRTVRLAHASIQDLTKELCSKVRDFTTTNESFEVFLPYLAWSTDIAFLYLENKRPGLSGDVKKTRAWAQALSSVVEFLPIQKQIPLFTPLVFSLPKWLVKTISPSLYRFVEVHKVQPNTWGVADRSDCKHSLTFVKIVYS